ncbi:hypothetical protein M514_23759 [Trichuris suis]|uniref:Reverse transcriptase zinc-binding domain-containing protein n=1 Tax=Trichuris suis TaxID=68888 RepID=A0A085N3K3_9BILA|nr:hypothetical protein M514_23759 [Trichuris suis]
MCRWNVLSNDAEGLHEAKALLARKHCERFPASYQGTGFKEFGDGRSNKWIDGERMTGHGFLAAIKAKTCLVPTRLQTLRGRTEPGDRRVLCRRCGSVSQAPESLAHISQHCAFNHGLIIRRHDTIVRKLASVAEASGFERVLEPVLGHQGQTDKPDLVLSKNDKSWVLDVAVPWESNDPLDRWHTYKCRKYCCLGEEVRSLTGTKFFGTSAIVIGARGAWSRQNDVSLRWMGWTLPYNVQVLLCTMVLEQACQIISWFMRSTDALSFRRTGGYPSAGLKRGNTVQSPGVTP